MEIKINNVKEGFQLRKPDPAPRDSSSCVIEGTTVLLKDGTEKAIEELNVFSPTKEGDTLLNIHGSEVYPVALISGPVENFPIVSIKIKTEKKSYNIKVSIWHSFAKNHFCLLPAFMFVEGDSILTSTGEGIVTSVEYEKYKGDLWNVFLASKRFKDNLRNINEEMMRSFLLNSLLGLQPKEHLLFYNGIPSGSFMLQKQLVEHYSQGINLTEFV
ncbi:hypothetical protein V7419_30030 [Bacillus sp. JJ689]|uniref:hypothetical protein n=1 Tax=Bacillus sp. JJ689 TaxID=3122949 RepID=UPI002FFFF17E